MKVVKNKIFGINETFISSCNEDLPNPPDKPFYIILSCNFNEEMISLLAQAGMTRLGVAHVHSGKMNITITGARKVSRAIDYILSGANGTYSEDKNQDLFLKLRNLKKQCDEICQSKPKKMAEKKELLSDFTDVVDHIVSPQHPKIPKPNNETRRVAKKDNPEDEYILKLNKSGRRISEIEAFNGTCYRVLLGNRHPRMRPVYDENGERVGVVSSVMPAFKSFHQKFLSRPDKITKINPNYLLKKEVVKVLVACYAEGENDAHGGNFGTGQSGYSEKIDADQATWVLTAKYISFDRTKQYSNLPTRPVNQFPITERDILSFPDLQDAKPAAWPKASEDTMMDFSRIKHTKKLNDDKYYMFLKRILIADEVYEAIGMAMIVNESTRKKLVDHKCMRTQKLKQVLLHCREFQDYVLANPKAIEQITKELTDYNADYTNENDAYLRIDLNGIRQNYDAITLEVSRLHSLNPPLTRKEKNERQTRKENRFVRFAKNHPNWFGFFVGLGIALLTTAILFTLALTGVLPIAAVGLSALYWIGQITLFGGLPELASIITGAVVSQFLVAGVGALLGKGIARIARSVARYFEKKEVEKDIELKKVEQEVAAKMPSNEIVQFRAKEKAYPSNFKYSAGLHSLFPANESLKRDIEDTKDIIFLLLDNFDFFKASLLYKDEFELWLEKNDKAAELYVDLITVLNDMNDSTQFHTAFFNGLQDGKGEEMKVLLCNHPVLRSVLQDFIKNQEVIAAWYKDHSTLVAPLSMNRR